MFKYIYSKNTIIYIFLIFKYFSNSVKGYYYCYEYCRIDSQCLDDCIQDHYSSVQYIRALNMFRSRKQRLKSRTNGLSYGLNGPFCGRQIYSTRVASYDSSDGYLMPVEPDFTRIVGGVDAQVGELPWIVSLHKPQSSHGFVHYCAGAIISDYYILTAAHCADNFIGRERTLEIRLGTNFIGEPRKGYTFTVSEIIIHEDWDRDRDLNDIALYKTVAPIRYLVDDVSGKYIVNSICLPKDDIIPDEALIAGWGQTGEEESISLTLKKVFVPNFNRKQCQINYKESVVDENKLCFGGIGGEDSCMGDSGGPLMEKRGQQFYVIGIVSFGIPCARETYPTVYTKVYSYIDWISQHIRQ